MRNGAHYRIKIKATYKDFPPIIWDQEVKYIQNLDGQVKFVDLGTHIFFKGSLDRPKENFKFILADVMDDNVDDDIDTFTLKLNDEMKDYKVLSE